jgi:hypothetical protein
MKAKFFGEKKMKIEEAVKRLSKITYVGEEYDTARKALLFWKKLRDSMTKQEVNEFGGQAFIGVSRIISIIEKYIWEIEREEDARKNA